MCGEHQPWEQSNTQYNEKRVYWIVDLHIWVGTRNVVDRKVRLSLWIFGYSRSGQLTRSSEDKCGYTNDRSKIGSKLAQPRTRIENKEFSLGAYQ